MVRVAVASAIMLSLCISLIAAACASVTLRAREPDLLLLFHSTGAMCVMPLIPPCEIVTL